MLNITGLVEGNEEKCDVLSVIDRLVDNKNRWVKDFKSSQCISSNRKMFSSYNLVGKLFYKQVDLRRNDLVSVS